MAFQEESVQKKERGLEKYFKTQKTAEVSVSDRLFYTVACAVGGGVALVASVILLIGLAGFGATYVWSTLALLLGSAAFYVLAVLRYHLTGNLLVRRFSDASIYAALFGAYTPLFLILVREALYENGALVTAWVSFGLVSFFAFFFFVTSLCADKKFRLTGSFFFLLMALSPVFSYGDLVTRIFTHAPALPVILITVAMLAFASTPFIFWFCDKRAWQFKVFYILMAVGTTASALLPVIWVFCGR